MTTHRLINEKELLFLMPADLIDTVLSARLTRINLNKTRADNSYIS